jgi:hypothetical protein
MQSYLVDLFVIAVMIAYIIDYKRSIKNYGKKGQGILYLVIIGGIALIVLRRMFFEKKPATQTGLFTVWLVFHHWH